MESDKKHQNILKGYNMLLYFAGSMILHEPTEECVVDFWKNGILKRLPVSSSNPSFFKAASQLRESCADKSICLKMLHEDYLRLFSRHDLPLAPAHESQYQKIEYNRLEANNPTVTEFYKSYGWKSKFHGRINDDHLGIEILFLTILIEKYLVMDDKACKIEMREEIRRFIGQHLLSWIPDWNEKMQTNSNTMCYKGIGTLIIACIEDIYEILG